MCVIYVLHFEVSFAPIGPKFNLKFVRERSGPNYPEFFTKRRRLMLRNDKWNKMHFCANKKGKNGFVINIRWFQFKCDGAY